MKSFILITALSLCSLSWNFVSGSEFQIVEVQSGEEVTLRCSKISRNLVATGWFRVINKTKPSCISSLIESCSEASFCYGFKNGLFEMSSNVTSVFLKIKQVNISDAGLYFCGFYTRAHTVFSSATELRIQRGGSNDIEDFKTEKGPDRVTYPMSIMLGVVTALLTIVVIILVLKIRKLQTAAHDELQPERSTVNPFFSFFLYDLNYAALSFQTKSKRSWRPATQRELEPHVVYAATR
ncbi:uncharacterized protein LOC135932678 [Pelmatolapia mariae]|uniref:uncharacterized protein LOC135932678 n=1 Tax=Pelmatolapia mariae TaxID=158779 RepID=UPI003211F5D0